jgi:hypothetical protein
VAGLANLGKKMTDLQLDFDALRTARTRVDDALSTFESAGTVGGDLPDSPVRIGWPEGPRLRGQLGLQPRKAHRELQFLRDGIDAIVDSMTEVDAELASGPGGRARDADDGGEG